METREDNFEFGTQCVFWAIRHYRNHLVALNDDESADAIVCFMALQHLNHIVDIVSPSEGDWPASQDGMGQVIPFIPRQRA
jgi:hypothetical protein